MLSSPARRTIGLAVLVALHLSSIAASGAEGIEGYYRMPSLRDGRIVFVAEGDLWKVSIDGGMAHRLTTHTGEETTPAISPDGETIAFCAQLEGPTEVYTMPASGGAATRWTYGGDRIAVVGWTPEGRILYVSRHESTLPNMQLFELDLKTKVHRTLPLSSASDAAIGDDGTLYFTRLPFQGSQTKRYRGGTARDLWKWSAGGEAVRLAGDDPSEHHEPMWWRGRLYFVTDRDGTMNVWSMKPDGSDLTQVTRYAGMDVKSPSIDNGRIVYQVGADLHRLNLADGSASKIPITLTSDLDQSRERWVQDPITYATHSDLSTDGESVAITARGEVFVFPRKKGRMIQIGRDASVRMRQALFMPDGESILVLTDQSGEVEFWQYSIDGYTAPKQLTRDASVLRFSPAVSDDGKWIAWQDKDQALWKLNLEGGEPVRIATNDWEVFSDVRFSPDSKWLAWVAFADNTFTRIFLHNLESGETVPITSDRVNSASPCWSEDGKWMYFLSDRNFETVVTSPWGPYQPEPFLATQTRVYALPLTGDEPSPFRPLDELDRKKKKEEEESAKREKEEQETRPLAADGAENGVAAAPDEEAGASPPEKEGDAKPAGEEAEKSVVVDFAGIQDRAIAVPVRFGRYGNLVCAKKHLYWITRDPAGGPGQIESIAISNEDPKVTPVASGVLGIQLSRDRSRLLVRLPKGIAIVDAGGAKADLGEGAVNLGGWRFPLVPRDEWRQMFVDSWRLMRDYFYDPNMHSVDWKGALEKYRPLVDRVTTRAELSDLISQMVGELSALHHFVVRGDARTGPDQIPLGALGAKLERDEGAGGFRIAYLYQHEPDFPERAGPLMRRDLKVKVGEVITHVDGVPSLSANAMGQLLRDRAGRQVRLRLRGEAGAERDVIVEPISAMEEMLLRYGDWERSRRLRVEELGGGKIGYVHLRAMGEEDWAQFAENFYPVFDRAGLIIDVRHNRGGNIDSWVLEKLMRQAWMYWQPRVGKPTWNMQYAFRGHMIMLCDENSASDGEAVCEGFRRLGLGKVLGVRTWGGEIWLSMSNDLVDLGIASAAELGVYGPEREWLIEGWGFEPDIVVENPPHATFVGGDAQLDAAVKHLLERIAEDPREVPPPPAGPDKRKDSAEGRRGGRP